MYWIVLLYDATLWLENAMSKPAVAPLGITCAAGLDAERSASKPLNETRTACESSFDSEKFFAVIELTHTWPKSSVVCDATTDRKSVPLSSCPQSRTSACVDGADLNFLLISLFSSGAGRPARDSVSPPRSSHRLSAGAGSERL